ncbi:MAG: L-fucokinase [Verrucomicrobiia bacterium]
MILPLTPTETLALAQAAQRNRTLYDRLRKGRVAGPPDYLVLTAANGRQAAAYRAELAARARRGFFPKGLRMLVVPDPKGQRMGTGGATLSALRAVARDCWRAMGARRGLFSNAAELLGDRRILVIHAGGKEPRVTGEAAPGKLFLKLPVPAVDGGGTTLFDELFATLAGAMQRLGPGLLVASGDVLLLCDAGAMRRAGGAVNGFAAPAPAEQAAQHGVYVCDDNGVVRRFLHKMGEDALRASGAVDALERAWVDTGLVGFCGTGLAALAALAGVSVGPRGLALRPALFPPGLSGRFDLYRDLLPALAAGNGASAAVRELSRWFTGVDFHTQRLSPAWFIHLQTPQEYAEAVAENGPVRAVFQREKRARRGLGEFGLDHLLAAEMPVAGLLERTADLSGAAAMCDALDRLAATGTPLERARVEYAHARLLGTLAERAGTVDAALQLRRRADAREEAAFAAISEAIGAAEPARRQARLAAPMGETITVELPVRIDFGGGWSDTPPHGLERGGTVLNAAVLLDGDRPVRASVRALAVPEVRLRARDLGCEAVLTDKDAVLNYRDPADPFALHKAALALAGVVTAGSASLEQCLRRFGGGVEVVTESRVPKGSGLGTSSILGACLVAALSRLCGQDARPATLFERVLHLEQMLTTGGGWQDQVGGLVPGVKLISSRPGVPQRLKVEPVALPAALVKELQRRLVLVYVGHRRLAKNILRSVMGGWLAREPEVVWILGRIQEIAGEMRAALLAGDLDWFGALMREHWELNKRLDPNSTNRHVEAVLSAAAPLASGFKMVGAGGGGFAEIVARGPGEAGRIERAVVAAGGRIYRWAMATQTL